MTQSKQLLTVGFLFVAASCNGRPQADGTSTASARRAAHNESDKNHNETMDKAGAPENESDGKTSRRVGDTDPIPTKPE